MKLTDKAKIQTFVNLVTTSSSLRGFMTALGFGRPEIKYHLQFLAEYEKVLAEPEAVIESIKVEPAKVEPVKVTNPRVGSTLRSFLEEVEVEEEEEEEGENEDTEGL